MNSELVRKWNERIKSEDMVYFLGDFCFKNSNESRGEGTRNSAIEHMTLLNGQKFWIKGNHDRNNSLKAIVDSATITWAGQQYFMVHDPRNANHNFDINFVGHVHTLYRFKKMGNTFLINVGVDAWNFYPQTVEELLNKFHHWRKHGEESKKGSELL